MRKRSMGVGMSMGNDGLPWGGGGGKGASRRDGFDL